MNDPKRGRLVPDWHALIEKAAKQQFVLVSQLTAGDTLEIQTDARRYSFKILDPERRRVELTSDDAEHPGPIEGCLQGSKVSPWGSSIFSDRVAVGLVAVFSSRSFFPGRIPPEIDLPPTRAVWLNGLPLLPADRDSAVR